MKLPLVLILTAAVLLASEPWTKNPQSWTVDDAQRILSSSPWAQTVKASFGDADREPPPPGPLPGAAEAGMAGPRGATDGHWDGGVGRIPRGTLPTLPVLIRWDSALPVREAAAHMADAPSAGTEVPANDYLITVMGLVPAKLYRDAGQLNGKSTSDDSMDARGPEELLEGLMASTRLLRRGKPPLAPENVRVDSGTGAVHIFFARTDPILATEKEVVFRTRFGSLTVEKLFRLRDMTYKGHLEL